MAEGGKSTLGRGATAASHRRRHRLDRLRRTTAFRLMALVMGALIVGRCGSPATERGVQGASEQPVDLSAWQAEITSQMQRVELHVPLLREIIQSGNLHERHVEVRRSHDLLTAAEQSVPHLPADVTDETAAIRQRYLNGVRELRWSAELLLWAIRLETTEELRQTYLNDAPYHLEVGARHLEAARDWLHGRDVSEEAVEGGTDDTLRLPEAVSAGPHHQNGDFAAMPVARLFPELSSPYE